MGSTLLPSAVAASSPPAAAVRGRGGVRREHRGMQLRRTSPQFVAAVAQGEGGREGRNGTGWGPLFSSTAPPPLQAASSFVLPPLLPPPLFRRAAASSSFPPATAAAPASPALRRCSLLSASCSSRGKGRRDDASAKGTFDKGSGGGVTRAQSNERRGGGAQKKGVSLVSRAAGKGVSFFFARVLVCCTFNIII